MNLSDEDAAIKAPSKVCNPNCHDHLLAFFFVIFIFCTVTAKDPRTNRVSGQTVEDPRRLIGEETPGETRTGPGEPGPVVSSRQYALTRND
ncbi:hypothetical protein BV898_08425 [Hypsibius exemplaris]|uniref:Uncharacterized protein n=1 Tax=Hypsibius exemplaris TaxID=2072580 RepID=A0A1W0WQM8_HYPEX|nr:hypothetical protein BV898_08425 [Hypsibius exemplaris]